MGAEYELKYRTDPDTLAAMESVFPQDHQTIRMQTTYYDTPTLALSARRYTLRCRLENGVSVCTVKTPGNDNFRGEWETECDDIQAAIPELCKPGCPEDLKELCKEGIQPVCGARFTRKAAIFTHNGSLIEMALDRGVLMGGGKEIPLCEVEFELKSGLQADVQDFAQHYIAHYHLTPESQSKFARARQLYSEE